MADTDLCDDGELHPGVSLWGIRKIAILSRFGRERLQRISCSETRHLVGDMVKRSATLQHVLGKQFTSLMFHVSAFPR